MCSSNICEASFTVFDQQEFQLQNAGGIGPNNRIDITTTTGGAISEDTSPTTITGTGKLAAIKQEYGNSNTFTNTNDRISNLHSNIDSIINTHKNRQQHTNPGQSHISHLTVGIRQSNEILSQQPLLASPMQKSHSSSLYFLMNHDKSNNANAKTGIKSEPQVIPLSQTKTHFKTLLPRLDASAPNPVVIPDTKNNYHYHSSNYSYDGSMSQRENSISSITSSASVSPEMAPVTLRYTSLTPITAPWSAPAKMTFLQPTFIDESCYNKNYCTVDNTRLPLPPPPQPTFALTMSQSWAHHGFKNYPNTLIDEQLKSTTYNDAGSNIVPKLELQSNGISFGGGQPNPAKKIPQDETIRNTALENLYKPLSEYSKVVKQAEADLLRTDSLTYSKTAIQAIEQQLQKKKQIFTYIWLLKHCRADPEGYVPRGLIFDRYSRACACYGIKPLSQASMGKLIRTVFPALTTRRLGTRGQSKYHYCGLRILDPMYVEK